MLFVFAPSVPLKAITWSIKDTMNQFVFSVKMYSGKGITVPWFATTVNA